MTVELDNSDPRVKVMLQRIMRQVARFVEMGYTWDINTVNQACDEVEELRTAFKYQHGFDFPRLTSFYMPSVNVLLFYRADLEYPVIRDNMVILSQKLVRRGIRPDAMEMSAAMVRAWPYIIKQGETDRIADTAARRHIKGVMQ